MLGAASATTADVAELVRGLTVLLTTALVERGKRAADSGQPLPVGEVVALTRALRDLAEAARTDADRQRAAAQLEAGTREGSGPGRIDAETLRYVRESIYGV